VEFLVMYVAWMGLLFETVDETSSQYPRIIGQKFSHDDSKGVDLFRAASVFSSLL
jgi:hypothetical protein